MQKRLRYLFYICVLMPIGLRAQTMADSLVVDTAMLETVGQRSGFKLFDMERRVTM